MRRTNQSAKPGDHARVAIIGGRSMMFSFGLDDDRSIPGQLASQARYPLAVYNAAWVGFDLFRSWHLFRRELEGEGGWKVAVLGVYLEGPEDFADLPSDLSVPPPPGPLKNLFRFMDGIVIQPTGNPLQTALGRDYYRSFLGYGVFSWLDQGIGRLRACLDHGGAPAAAPGAPPVDRKAIGLARFQDFLRYVEGELGRGGTKVLVVFLPSPTLPASYYAELESSIPEGIARVDLQKELGAELANHRYIASGHWGAEQARLIGGRIAREVDRLLDEAGTRRPASPAAPGE
jgi:hypothetical protein